MKIKRPSKFNFLIVLALLSVVIVGFIVPQLQPQQHCVGPVQSIETSMMPPPTLDPDLNALSRCFETPSEAIEYATGGAVKLPRNASWEELDRALEAYYATLESENTDTP
jgi:hypothetical protein